MLVLCRCKSTFFFAPISKLAEMFFVSASFLAEITAKKMCMKHKMGLR